MTEHKTRITNIWNKTINEERMWKWKSKHKDCYWPRLVYRVLQSGQLFFMG